MDILLEQIQKINRTEDAQELLFSLTKENQTIKDAVAFSTHYHKDQFRKSGAPYIVHPILVAAIVCAYGGDEQMVVAALLHDVIEDTPCKPKEVREKFGEEIEQLVQGLTKIVELRDEKLLPSTSDEKLIASALSFRNMLLASISDVRVLVIKLCDRLHNMLTLEALSDAKQKRIAEETLVVYVPIAHRLGIATIKNALEDLSFYYLFPTEYQTIDEHISQYQQRFLLELNSFISKVKTLMLKNGFIDGDFEIEKRIKHHYSIYLKMHRKGVSIEEVLDLMAIRILVKNPIDCYRVLGILHQNFRPLLSRFKDYIAVPKDNGYQTIHTTVFDDATILEAQIRTQDMHKTAQYGVASHWKYKGHEGLNPKLEWLNELKTQSDEGENIEHMYELAKDDLYSEDISVYSPKGDVFHLPRGATVLDFAYAVHTEIGDHTRTAFVNKVKTPLLTELRNGDIIRIVLDDHPVLRCSWISSLKTAKAKNSMRINCNHKLKELNTQTAINILLGIFNLKYESLHTVLEQENSCKNVYKSAIEVMHLQENINQLKKAILKNTKFLPIIPPFKKYTLKKQVFDNLILYAPSTYSKILFDYCCHPKRGDEIVAFKKGNDVMVHHKFCTHATKLMQNHEQMVFVRWSDERPDHYKLIVSIENKKGSLASFLLFLAKIDIDLLSIELERSENSHTDYFELVVEIPKNSKEKLLQDLNQKYKIIEFVPLDDAYKKI
ncbi:MAG: RelA/SpoT family protein [Epsilonproteobacteria bacterium]|nr:RelA/SpoT family protein [Campylobacterota bacterium]